MRPCLGAFERNFRKQTLTKYKEDSFDGHGSVVMAVLGMRMSSPISEDVQVVDH